MQRIHIKKEYFDEQCFYIIQYQPSLRGDLLSRFSDYKSFLRQISYDIDNHPNDKQLEVRVREDPASKSQWDELGIKLFSYAQRNVMPKGMVKYIRYESTPISSQRDTA